MKNKLFYRVFGLDKLEADLNRLGSASEKAFFDSARDIASEYQSAFHYTGTVDSGDAAREVTAKQFIEKAYEVYSAVNYELFPELGVKTRPKYPKREPAKRALEKWHAENKLEARFTEQFDKILGGK